MAIASTWRRQVDVNLKKGVETIGSNQFSILLVKKYGLPIHAAFFHLTDRTNWQRMLKNEVINADLVATKASLTGTLDADLRRFVDTDDTVCSINYPVNHYPEKVKSVGFDKQAEIEGCLAGIKGQYLIFDDSRVLNIRKHNGYRITMT